MPTAGSSPRAPRRRSSRRRASPWHSRRRTRSACRRRARRRLSRASGPARSGAWPSPRRPSGPRRRRRRRRRWRRSAGAQAAAWACASARSPLRATREGDCRRKQGKRRISAFEGSRRQSPARAPPCIEPSAVCSRERRDRARCRASACRMSRFPPCGKDRSMRRMGRAVDVRCKEQRVERPAATQPPFDPSGARPVVRTSARSTSRDGVARRQPRPANAAAPPASPYPHRSRRSKPTCCAPRRGRRARRGARRAPSRPAPAERSAAAS